MNKEVSLFDARFSVPRYTTSNGIPAGEPQARLTFPDKQTATDFINIGRSEDRYARRPITTEYLDATHEAPMGPYGEYDAFVSRPDEDTGNVMLFVRRHGHHELPAHARLSNFVIETAQRMAMGENEQV